MVFSVRAPAFRVYGANCFQVRVASVSYTHLDVYKRQGIRFVGEIPKDWSVECYVVSASYAAEYDITELEKRAEVYVLTDHLFADVAETENPQGIMAICGRKEYDLAEMLEKKNAFFLMAEEMNDPGNLGTVIRTADACAVDAIFLSKGSVDPVSYTHLDVYKRQVVSRVLFAADIFWLFRITAPHCIVCGCLLYTSRKGSSLTHVGSAAKGLPVEGTKKMPIS